MQPVLRKLFFFLLFLVNTTWHVADFVNVARIIELSDQIRRNEDIRSMVVFSQKSFVVNMNGYEELLQQESKKIPLVVIGEDYDKNQVLGHILGLWSTVLVFMDSIENQKMFSVVNETLRNIHESKMIFVLETPPRDYESLIRFFEACLRLGIVNVVIFSDDQVLTYEPFPRVVVENITSKSITEFYPDRSYDLKGYVFHTPIQQDGSRVFIYTDKDGKEKITGVNTEIFRSFVQRHNATFERLMDITNHSGFDILGGLSLLTQGKVDILMHSYSSFAPNLFAFSYPIAQIEWQMVVPYVGEISAYRYLILPFDCDVWLYLGLSFIYISLASYLTQRYCQHLNEYGPAFSRSLIQLLYLPSTALRCNMRALIFEMQIFCYGLVLTNIYLAFLSAFLTTTVQGNQIESMEDLLQSGYKILSIHFEVLAIMHTSGYNKRYDGIYEVENIDFINEYRKSLNKTFAFVFAEDRANFFLGQQKYLEKKRMHVAKNTLGTYFLTFIMQKDSPFRKNFDGILLQLYETGLYKKWEVDVFNQAVAAKYLQIFRTESEDSFRSLTIAHLGVGWITFIIGIGLSFVVLAIEVLRYRIGKKTMRRR